MLYDTESAIERVLLIGLDNDQGDVTLSLDELAELAATADAEVVGRMTQKRDAPHRRHYFGKGKIDELKQLALETNATSVLCDDELTANQIRDISEMLDMKVIDRTLVILDIFAKHAKSAESKDQIELAQLKYNLSHLKGASGYLSRLGGGIGTRGPGEKKLEMDRRKIRERISELSADLTDIETHRQVMREKRMRQHMPLVALVGYTNAGKSTLMNVLTEANVLAEDKLFATLDTTIRKAVGTSDSEYLLIDTIGFIQKLPHTLIKSFKATLEELQYADILIHVVDTSNPLRDLQMKTVYDTLKELRCIQKPIITVFNKIDKDDVLRPFPPDSFAIKTLELSAKNTIGIDQLELAVDEVVKSSKDYIKALIPFSEGALLSLVHKNCLLVSQDHTEDGVCVEIFADEEMKNKLEKYILSSDV